MALFGKKKSAEELGREIAVLVRDRRQHKLNNETYTERFPRLAAEFKVGAQVGRFGLDDVDMFLAQGEALNDEDRLPLWGELQRAFIAIGDHNPFIKYALTLISSNIVQMVVPVLVRLNQEQRWAESLTIVLYPKNWFSRKFRAYG